MKHGSMALRRRVLFCREVIGAQIFALSVNLCAVFGKKTCLAFIFPSEKYPFTGIQEV